MIGALDSWVAAPYLYKILQFSKIIRKLIDLLSWGKKCRVKLKMVKIISTSSVSYSPSKGKSPVIGLQDDSEAEGICSQV